MSRFSSGSTPRSDGPIDVQGVGAIDRTTLIREAELLHRQFFQRDASPKLLDFYTLAHSELLDLTQASDGELRTVQLVVERHLDALGIEPWLRSSSGRHLLSRKLLLIAYLAECDAAHSEFRREAKSRAVSYVRLGQSGAKAAFRLLRGRIQKALHGLL